VRIPALNGDDDEMSATQFLENLSKTKAAAKAVQENISELEPIVEEMMEAQQLVGPYKQIKKDLAAARRKYKALKAALVKRLEEARAKLSAKDDKEIVLDLIREGMARHLERYVVAHRQQVVAVAENWWDKYAVPMDVIEKDRERAARALSKMVGGLGYGL
jgi:type I restriction enzyme M protein